MSQVTVVIAFVVVAILLEIGCGVPSCNDLDIMVAPCIPYVTDQSAIPEPECCKGVLDMFKMGVTKEDRQAICECMKAAISAMQPNLDLGRALGLPNTCKAKTCIPIGPDVNFCSMAQPN